MPDPDHPSEQPVFTFGTFQLFPRMGRLRDNGRDVRLGSRAVELLAALVERAGEVAASSDLIARVWPTTTVDEHNLRVQVAGLRKALADGHQDERFIATVPGRGYRFAVPVVAATQPLAEAAGSAERGNLPAALTRLFGREAVIDDVRRRLRDERLLSLVGPGGVGKTSVAVAAAHDVAVGPAWFADLAPVSDPGLIPTVLLEALGLAASPENMPAAVARRLGGQSALLVLDNCEHLIEACASIAEALLGAAPGLRILATSREPLRAAGEWVLRLPALVTPPAETSLEQAAACSAVQLFVHRAASSDNGFSLADTSLAPVVEICRRLDGIPLALELAAATVGSLGVRGVAQRLRERLDLPSQGRRAAATRQTNLRAILDWSYRLLSPAEQRALRRLAVFQGAFTLESATNVAGPSQGGEASMLELLAGLAEKSLLSVDLTQDTARYRLLQTTRAFALDRPTPREAAATRARHAREMRRLVEAAGAAWSDGPQPRRHSADLIDDLGVAVEWALSPLGDIDTATDLIVVAAPLRRRLSLLADHRKQVDRALDQVRALSPPNPAAEMRLLGSYGLASSFQFAHRDRIIAAAERLQALALELGDAEHLMLGLWDRATVALLLSDMPTYRRCADQLRETAARASSDAYRATAHHMSQLIAMQDGDLATARDEGEAGLALLEDERSGMHIARLGFDPTVYIHDLLAPLLWAVGLPEQALTIARLSLTHCRRLSHEQSLGFALADIAARVALLVGDVELASTYLEEHRVHCEERGERGYTALAQAFMQAVLRVERTGVVDPAAAAMVTPGSLQAHFVTTPELAARIAEALGRSGRPDDGLAAIETISAQAGPTEGWYQPELARVRAVLLRMTGAPVPDVEEVLRRGLAQARRMGALSLELRVTTTLAELLSDEGRPAEALEMLAGVTGRIVEGHHAKDYRRAVALTERLSVG
jgi:predicted ATPase/DNA-binding winged helix-turn-helix (wHTH) protein